MIMTLSLKIDKDFQLGPVQSETAQASSARCELEVCREDKRLLQATEFSCAFT